MTDDFLTTLPHRAPLRISGSDTLSFLNGLVTADVATLPQRGALYTCLLTPQGKFLHDGVLLWEAEGSLLWLAERERLDHLAALLRKYKLRAAVTLDALPGHSVFVSSAPHGTALQAADPRHTALVIIGSAPEGDAPPFQDNAFAIYEQARIAHAIPDGSRDMLPEKAILLENHIDALGGIAWEKGCYMGQELTARTRYRGLVRKKLLPVHYTASPPAFDTPLLDADGKEVAHSRSHSGMMGLALVRDGAQQPGTVLTDPQGNALTVLACP